MKTIDWFFRPYVFCFVVIIFVDPDEIRKVKTVVEVLDASPGA